ncbi:helix-turn-helix domain-containing protein [Litorilituus sediminis]|nr:helix-turn-helix transcriptional regulator [Litorilituus sediminis]
MHISTLELVDLFLRFVTLGQLVVLALYFLVKSPPLKSDLIALVCLCLSSYLLLTAPIDDDYYGVLRGAFLFFVEIGPYLLWCLAYLLFNDALPKQFSSAISQVLLALALVWYLYFFGYLQGRGAFHQINHLLEFVVLVHLIVLTIKDYADDLVDARRNARKIMVIYTCLYLLVLVVLELADASIRGSAIFTFINALAIFISTSVFIILLFLDKFTEVPAKVTNSDEGTEEIPVVFQGLHQQLTQLMQSGFYSESQLTISALAQKLNTPEHQLREMINKHMGFRNFSAYLNSYRIAAACEQFQDANLLRKPILTIALELGYGSVATFNRAFKAQTGKSPKEFRDQFQK